MRMVACGMHRVATQVLTHIDGEPAICYNHAKATMPLLMQPETPLPKQVCLTLRERGGGNGTWRDHIRQQLQVMGGSGDVAAHQRPAENDGNPRGTCRTWAESAGRPGSPGYQWGDLTRVAARRAGRYIRPIAWRLSGSEARAFESSKSAAEAPEMDLAGWLGKRSEMVGQWRSRFFRLEGSKLVWSRQVDDPAHGQIDLKGMPASLLVRLLCALASPSLHPDPEP